MAETENVKMAGSNTINNTKDNGISKRNIFLLTVNPASLVWYDEIKEYLTKLKSFRYMLCTEHFGQEEKHYHICVQFNVSIRLSIKKLHGCHIDVIKYGSIQKMIDYCLCKDEKHKNAGVTAKVIDEIGEAKLNGGRYPATIREIQEMSREEIKEIDPRLQKIANEIKNEYEEEKGFMEMLDEIEKDELKGPEIVWVLGDSGMGKTYGAYKYAIKNYDKKKIGRITIDNNFFAITNKEAECFVVEEFRPSQLAAANFLQFTDKYGYKAPVKGSHVYLRPKCIIICSIISPSLIYKEEINKQFVRRVTRFYKAVNKNLVEIPKEEIENDEILI